MNLPRSSHSKAAAVLAVSILVGCSEATGPEAGPDIYAVKRGTLRISVRESGELNAARETRVKSEVEGQATVIWLVEEGSIVEKGDKLVELDASDLEERKATQEISLEKSRAALVEAEQNLEIQKKEIKASEESARSALQIARMEEEKFLGRMPVAGQISEASNGHSKTNGAALDAKQKGTNAEMLAKLDKLVRGTRLAGLVSKARELIGDAENLERDMGEMAQEILKQIDKVRLADADLKLKENTLKHSETLHAKKYITRQEYDKDKLSHESQLSQVTLEKNKLDILINYTLKTQQIQLSQDVENARLELERVIASNIARRAREEADFSSKTAEHKLAKERFDNLVKQIKNANIYAPTPGLVVYAQQGDGRRGREVVEEGMSVYQRRTLISLPDVTKMVCDIKIKEADVHKVAVGQRAGIKVDAFPGVTFTGRLTRVSPVADSGSRWSNNDLKVYKSRVTLDPSEHQLRPGMSGNVEIVVEEIPDTLYVPIQGVRRQGAVHFVWKQTDRGPEAQQVEVGRNNLTHVEIVKGVVAADRIYLAPPRGAKAPEFKQPESSAEGSATPSPDGESEKGGAKADPAANSKPAEASAKRDGKSQGGSSGGDARAKMTKLGNELRAALVAKFPDRKEELSGRGFFRVLRDDDIKAAIEADADLSAKMEEWRALARSAFSGGRGRGRGEGGRGERGRGKRPSGRNDGERRGRGDG